MAESLLLIELQNVQESDTTDDDSSNEAGYKTLFLLFNCFNLISRLILTN
jgi:hypothetical protein